MATAPSSPIRYALWRVPTRAGYSNDRCNGFLDGVVELPVGRSVERHFLNHIAEAIFDAR